jgi:hypothetical protein
MPRFNKAYFPLIHSSCPKHCAARLSVLNIITVPDLLLLELLAKSHHQLLILLGSW